MCYNRKLYHEMPPHAARVDVKIEDLQRMGIEPRVLPHVLILMQAGIRTYQSCEGGDLHSCPRPTVYFIGTHADALMAVGVALYNRLPVHQLRREFEVRLDYGVNGPVWEIDFELEPSQHFADLDTH